MAFILIRPECLDYTCLSIGHAALVIEGFLNTNIFYEYVASTEH